MSALADSCALRNHKFVVNVRQMFSMSEELAESTSIRLGEVSRATVGRTAAQTVRAIQSDRLRFSRRQRRIEIQIVSSFTLLSRLRNLARMRSITIPSMLASVSITNTFGSLKF